MDEQKRQRLADRGRHLSDLARNPNYLALKVIVESKIDRTVRQFIGTAVVSQQELDYGRGLMEGMSWVLRAVEGGERELAKAVEAAEELERE